MIYYEEERKELIIPSGFSCADAIDKAYEAGYNEGYEAGLAASNETEE